MLRIVIHSELDHPRLVYTIAYLDQHPLSKTYGLRFILNEPLKRGDLHIIYGCTDAVPDFNFQIPLEAFFFQSSDQQASYFPGEYHIENEIVYSIERSEQTNASSLIIGKRFQFDLFNTIFFHISRFEEHFAPEKAHNSSGWLDEEHHFLVQYSLEKEPVADQLIAAFLQIISGQKIKLSTTYDLSHDIDFLLRFPNHYSLLRALAGKVRRLESISSIKDLIKRYQKIKFGKLQDPYDCFDWLLSTEDHWSKKQLYLMAGGETSFDNHYSIDDPLINKLISLAQKRNYFIGLHPSYNAGFKADLFRDEKAKLEQQLGRTVRYSRQHLASF